MIIKSHKELAEHVAGKRILLTNSYGKDSILTLLWLIEFACVEKIVSIHYKFLAEHPGDAPYLKYLRLRFPSVTFIERPNSIELNCIHEGYYQSPLFDTRNEWIDFDRGRQTEEIREEFNCDYIASGFSKYEGFARAARFYKEGLIKGKHIYPLGLMSKIQVYEILRSSNIKLHPMYKTTNSTYDHISYWKMRAGLIADLKYRQNVFRYFPLLSLDEYRCEVLCKEKVKK